MCAIFGFSPWVENYNDLANLNVKRGNNGFGGISITDTREVTFKYSVPYSKVTEIPEGVLVMCHTVASTGEAKRIHPFETDRFVLAHNGIILNYKEFNNWRIGPIDSQYILGGIQSIVDSTGQVIEAIRIVNEKLNGQRACWLWDKFEKIAYFWRVMSPLYYTTLPNFVFSSVGFERANMMEEGIIYSYNYMNNDFYKWQSFKFYSPYEVN